MHTHARAFAHCVQPIDDHAFVLVVLRHNLAIDIGWNTTHLVVNRWHHRNGFFGDVHVGEIVTNLKHRWQTLHDGFYTQMRHVQVDVVFIRTATATFFDLLIHAT